MSTIVYQKIVSKKKIFLKNSIFRIFFWIHCASIDPWFLIMFYYVEKSFSTLCSTTDTLYLQLDNKKKHRQNGNIGSDFFLKNNFFFVAIHFISRKFSVFLLHLIFFFRWFNRFSLSITFTFLILFQFLLFRFRIHNNNKNFHIDVFCCGWITIFVCRRWLLPTIIQIDRFSLLV